MTRRPFIVDLGWRDEGLALLGAASAPQLELAGVCAFDRPSRDVASESARRLGLALGAPIAAGMGRLLGAPSEAPGSEGAAAHVLVRDLATARAGELEVLALGPLSNLARAILSRPEVARLVRRVYVAGGAHAGGDASPAAERSILADPEAAKVVFESGIPIAMIGLDVEERARLSFDEARSLRAGLEFAAEARDEGYVRGLGLATLLSALDEGVISFRECHVDVEIRGELTYGKTVCDVDNPRRGRPNAKVALGLDRARFLEAARRLLS
jgi:pyrimidine-specific ribonucleoside hydrolase